MKTALRVLMVENSQEEADLLLLAFNHAGYQSAHARVQTAQSFRTLLNRQSWDLIVSEYVVPGFGGLAALEILKESGLDIPFIIISGEIGEDVAVEALHSGANDCLLKDNLTRLGPAIGRALKEAAQKRQRKHAEKALKESEERYRRLVEFCPEAMFIATANNIVFANPAAVALLGAKSPAEVINHAFLDFIDPSCRALALEHLRHCLEGVDAPLLEQKMVRLDGGHQAPLHGRLCRLLSSVRRR